MPTTSHPRIGTPLSLTLDQLHIISWEFVFAFDRLNDHLESRGMRRVSAYELAQKVGLSPSTVYNLWSGRTQVPHLTTVLKIAKYLGYSVDLRRIK